MHNCRRIETQLVDLLFDDVAAGERLRLLREIESCANCLGQYHTLSETLYVFDRTTEAALPPESYWPRYDAALRQQLMAPPSAVIFEPPRPSFWKNWLTMKLPIPLPVAAALVIVLMVSSALALRPTSVSSTTSVSPNSVATPAPPVDTIKIVEVPVIQERIVTRTVYVEMKRPAKRQTDAQQLAGAGEKERNEAGPPQLNQTEEEAGFFTRANLNGFQPADEMKIRVIKRNATDEK